MTKYSAMQGYVLREWDGEYLLIPVKLSEGGKPQMAILNSCGGMLWNALAEAHSFEELLELVISEYEVTRETAARDVREFLNMLEGFGLLNTQKA